MVVEQETNCSPAGGEALLPLSFTCKTRAQTCQPSRFDIESHGFIVASYPDSTQVEPVLQDSVACLETMVEPARL